MPGAPAFAGAGKLRAVPMIVCRQLNLFRLVAVVVNDERRAGATSIHVALAASAGGAASQGSVWVLLIGLVVAIVLMAIAANYIANMVGRYPWIPWIGILIIVWVALGMIFGGSREVACAAGKGVWCAPDLPSLLR